MLIYSSYHFCENQKFLSKILNNKNNYKYSISSLYYSYILNIFLFGREICLTINAKLLIAIKWINTTLYCVNIFE